MHFIGEDKEVMSMESHYYVIAGYDLTDCETDKFNSNTITLNTGLKCGSFVITPISCSFINSDFTFPQDIWMPIPSDKAWIPGHKNCGKFEWS